jgi:sugar-specific transcriptional regulator TrmB
MMPAKEILTHFSVTADETDVYLALLALGTANVTEIAKKIKKNRTASYFHVRKLVEKELVSIAKQGRVLKFTATPPDELAGRFDRLVTDFKSLVPQMEALKKAETETPRVEVSESRSGYLKIYDEISSLPIGEEFIVIEGKDALNDELKLLTDAEWNTFFKRIIDRKIRTRLLLTAGSLDLPKRNLSADNYKLLDERQIQTRYVGEDILPIKNMVIAYGNTLAYLFPETNLVMTVRHKGIVDSFKATFEALFGIAKPHSFA